jgi:hypothetical protein
METFSGIPQSRNEGNEMVVSRIKIYNILLSTVLFFITIQVASAFTVSNVHVTPEMVLNPSTPVSISLNIDLPPTEINGTADVPLFFLTTQLVNPEWNVSFIEKSGMPLESPVVEYEKSNITISGNGSVNGKLISEGQYDFITITLTGFAPHVSQTMNKTLINIQEQDSNNPELPPFSLNRLIVNCACIDCTETITLPLEDFRNRIDENISLGIDTAYAQNEYLEARSFVSAARNLPSQDYTECTNFITAAQNAIENGSVALDEEYAKNNITTQSIVVSPSLPNANPIPLSTSAQLSPVLALVGIGVICVLYRVARKR